MKFTWDLDPVIVQLGPFGLRYYGLLFMGVFLGGYALYARQVRRAGGSDEDGAAILMPGVLGTIIGARLGHVFFYEPARFLRDPLWIFQFWKGGLASHGAVLGLLAAIWWMARRRRQSYVECLDRFTFSGALAVVLVRIGNFLNSEIVGRVTDQSWGVKFPRYFGDRRLPLDQVPYRHPSQLYEAAAGLLILAGLYLADRALGKEKRPRGVMISLFFLLFGVYRFLVEFIKEYQVASHGLLTMGQILTLPLILGGLAGLVYSLKKGVPAGWNAAPAPAGAPAPGRRSGGGRSGGGRSGGGRRKKKGGKKKRR